MKDGQPRRVLKTFYPGRGFRKSGFSVTVKAENQCDQR